MCSANSNGALAHIIKKRMPSLFTRRIILSSTVCFGIAIKTQQDRNLCFLQRGKADQYKIIPKRNVSWQDMKNLRTGISWDGSLDLYAR